MRIVARKGWIDGDEFKSFALAEHFKSRLLLPRFKLSCQVHHYVWMSQMSITEGFCPNLPRLQQVRAQHLEESRGSAL